MKRALRLFAQYKLLTLAVLAAGLGLLLYFTGNREAAKWFVSAVALIEVIPILWSMWQDIKVGKYGIDILAATAIIASVLLGEYWAAIVVVIMYTGGEALESYANFRARAELNALLKRAPQKAHVIRKGKEVDVAVSELHIGDKIIIKPGELVPVDATIIDGTADFDESSLTGESLPQSHTVGDIIVSGSINIDGAITAKATASAEDSQYQQIVKLVKSASASQAPFVRLADRYSIPFTIMAFAIAISVWVLSGDPVRFLQVIIVATPCPLLLAAPIALISGMSRASKYGIIVKTGASLEKLAEVETIAFDKTGTLTSGSLTVVDIKTHGDFSADQVLAIAASMEQSSNHVLAKAVVSAATVKALKITKAKHIKEIAGRGIHGSVNSRKILVGRHSLLDEYDIAIPADLDITKLNNTAVYVAINGVCAGVLLLEDTMRDETPKTLKALRALGIKHIAMITGDNHATAQKIAKQLGIDRVHSDMMPADKLHVLASIKERPLAFVGDGVNDAPALTSVDVGIALGARGSTAASESADMVILADDISRVAVAVAVAKRTFKIAQQSILIGIGISLALMAAFATGKFSPLLGAVLQEVVDVVVIFNALRAHTGKPL